MKRDQFTDAVMFGIGITLDGRHILLEDAMTKELPLYISHKKVRALEIRSIGSYATDATDKLIREIVFADPAFKPIWAPGDLFARYTPMPGDYYVVYEDGYASFSPRKAFLEGYTLAQDGNVLMDHLQELSEFGLDYKLQPGDAVNIARAAREAYVTINSLKFQIEQLKADATITRQMAGFKEVKK